MLERNKIGEILIGVQIGIGVMFVVLYWLGFRGLVLDWPKLFGG